MHSQRADYDIISSDLIRELAAHCALSGYGTAANGLAVDTPLNPDSLRKLALLQTELLQVGTLVSIVASIANRILAQPDGRVSTAALISFKPEFTSIGVSLAEALIREPTLFELAQHWQNVNARLSFARALSHNAADPTLTRDDLFSDHSSGIIADSWLRVCNAILELYGHIANQLAIAGIVCDPSLNAVALDLLRSAASGAEPCIDLTGRLCVPGWAERRAELRRAVRRPVVLRFGSARYAAMLVDVTSAGLGIEMAAQVPVNASVTVQLNCGRELNAVVRWSKGNRSGVELINQLRSDDLLLVE